jgi:pSer/pThr/pTyr-binding forkhead associated (FHA) protein
MPSLILLLKNKKLMEYTLADGTTITIGRHSSNDIVIDNLVVSGLHAHVDFQNEQVTITDLQSKNGTYLNGEKISQAVLHHDDIVTIGKYTLQVNTRDLTATKHPDNNLKPAIDHENTMALDEYLTAARSDPARQATADKPVRRGKDYLVWLAGGQGEIELTDAQLQIGKNEDAQIVVKGLRASLVGAPAAVITKQSGEYWLAYAAGIVKPKHNGSTVKDRVKLAHNDVITIGPAKLQIQLCPPSHG